MRLSYRVRILLSVAFLCVVVVAVLGFLYRGLKHENTVSVSDEIHELQNSDYRTYFNAHIDELYQQEGIAGMVRRVVDALRTNQISMFDCHSLAHDIGHYAGYPDHFAAIESTLTKEHLDFCGSGFLHGVEGQLANETYPENATKLRKFCELVQPLEPYYQGCYHGAGHAFMENTRDPAAALRECESLITDALVPDVTHCYRGVFSEYSDYEHQAGKNSEALLAFCNTLQPELQVYCAQEINGLHVAATASEEEVAALLRVCTNSEYGEVIQDGCVRSVAGVVADHTVSARLPLMPSAYVESLPKKLRISYIEATYGSFRKTAAYDSTLSFTAFCEHVHKDDREYCSLLPGKLE